MKQDKQSPISAEHHEDSDESLQLFRQAVQDARPLTKKHVSHPKPKPKPIPLARYRDWETDRKSTRLNSSHRL